jgi:hypothetical protein
VVYTNGSWLRLEILTSSHFIERFCQDTRWN